jgi:hypothetical protein
MMAGLTEMLWTLEDLYDAVMKQQAEKKHRTRVEKPLRKLSSLDQPSDQLESRSRKVCRPLWIS